MTRLAAAAADAASASTPGTAIGPILAIGGVDILIPPSGLAVCSELAGISISGLLIGGIVPGLILSALFIGYVLIRCTLNPSLAPAYDDDDKPHVARPWLNLLVTVVPLIAVFACRRQHDAGLGDAHGIERARRGWRRSCSRPAIAASRRRTCGNRFRHGLDLGLASFHHRRRHHVRAAAELSGATAAWSR